MEVHSFLSSVAFRKNMKIYIFKEASVILLMIYLKSVNEKCQVK